MENEKSTTELFNTVRHLNKQVSNLSYSIRKLNNRVGRLEYENNLLKNRYILDYDKKLSANNIPYIFTIESSRNKNNVTFRKSTLIKIQ